MRWLAVFHARSAFATVAPTAVAAKVFLLWV